MSSGPEGWEEQASELLQKAVQVEYSFITNYRFLADSLPDQESREVVRILAEESAVHADVVASVIRALGGVPSLFDGALPAAAHRENLKRQLKYDKLALLLHSQAARLAGPGWRDLLAGIADVERRHIKMLEKVLERFG